MVSRRAFLAGSAGVAASVRLAGPAWAAPKLTDDGLYHQPWFLESLLELADDLDAAAAQPASASPSCGSCAAARTAATPT